ncbi:hypothetical protein [Streptosporangium sp. NPDC020145]|uniref:Uncharacterized protein n=1 Tax=Streptosporangium jomthongense TaxID=1193683 RepID=A0ABV8FE45_9ACTN
MGSSLLGMFVPRVEASAACGPVVIKSYSSCWECKDIFGCGWNAPCDAYCQSGCGCDVRTCYC